MCVRTRKRFGFRKLKWDTIGSVINVPPPPADFFTHFPLWSPNKLVDYKFPRGWRKIVARAERDSLQFREQRVPSGAGRSKGKRKKGEISLVENITQGRRLSWKDRRETLQPVLFHPACNTSNTNENAQKKYRYCNLAKPVTRVYKYHPFA